MAPDLRVRAVVRPPRQGRASDSEEAVDRDEEWADSAEEAVESGEEEPGTSSSSSKQRRSEASDHLQPTQSGEQPVVLAPPLETIEFGSWDSLEAYLKDYSAETYQVRLAFWLGSGWAHEILVSFLCGVQINACVQVANSAAAVPTFVLRFTLARLEHNHPLTRHTFDNYPHNRTAIEPEVVHTVSELAKAGAKKKRILHFIHENSNCNPMTQDVHNLVQKLKKRCHTAPSAAKRLKQWMTEFSQEPGNVGGVFVDSVVIREYGFTSWQKRQLDGLINLLVYARTERQYYRLRKYMRHIMDVGTGKKTVELTRSGEIELCSGRAELGTVGGGVGPRLGAVGSLVGRQLGAVRDEMCSKQECVPATGEDREFNHPFEDYFMKNWDNCRQMWCAF
ncbi:unnamed protein product [Phytophthora fragariaefolia]|uniref:Unnamed protein product n=1 Tax=Phytophthora fragariaefolia TaxID=1490495 RepID=A0A9W6XVC3_9STRA|nr:unnamed protein product [Phytophthora fragariaefolia]